MYSNSAGDQTFLKRLTTIVEANLSNEQFGVTELAAKMGVSRSQIHRKLKLITNQSVSQYIREIRLKKAKEFLEKNEFTVSEIAYKVGFGSPSYFIKCFHEYFGYPPGEYLKYAPESSSERENTGNEIQKPSSRFSNLISGKYRKYSILFFLLVSFVIIIYLVVQSISKETEIPFEKTIAIFTMTYNGEDLNVQTLAEGIMDDISYRLSGINGLTVKSYKSVENYTNSTKTTPQIAKEFGISYFLTGTILKEGEIVRIYIQLIDAVNDKQVWYDLYEKDLSGILEFISDVSGQVAEHLKTVLTKNEIELIEKVYTENTEAYQLYRKGRYFCSRRTKDNLDKSLHFFNQALTVDPNYALAWAGLAEAYNIMAWWEWIPKIEGLEKSKDFVMKSLELDNNLPEAHVVLGQIALESDQNWEVAEREFKLALKLNPNLSMVQENYADYLMRYRGKFEEAIEHYNIAINLEPFLMASNGGRAYCLYVAGKFNESLEDFEMSKDMYRFNRYPYRMIFLIYLRQGEDLKAIEELKAMVSIFYPEVNTKNLLEDIYSKSGIEGIVRWYIKLRLENGEEIGIDRVYAAIGDWDNALTYLKKNPMHNRDCIIKYGIEFKPIHNDPRFIALIKEWGLEDL